MRCRSYQLVDDKSDSALCCCPDMTEDSLGHSAVMPSLCVQHINVGHMLWMCMPAAHLVCVISLVEFPGWYGHFIAWIPDRT